MLLHSHIDRLSIRGENNAAQDKITKITAELQKRSMSELTDDFILYVGENTLALALSDAPETRTSIDFTSGKSAHRRVVGGGANQAMTKAIGLNRERNLHIIDATGGLARDAFVLASFAEKVDILEQSPLLCLLIEHAIQHARNDADIRDIALKMQLHPGNSITYLEQLEDTALPDVIYIDPMYPTRKKKASVKKEMQLLHRLIGPAEDADTLLETASTKAKKRIVVKRPAWATPLTTFQLVGDVRSKNTRYDIYKPTPDYDSSAR